MHFLAVCTMNDDDCIAQLSTGKDDLVSSYKADLEARLGAVEWLVSDDVLVLQALVIYVVRTPIMISLRPRLIM